MKYSDPEHLRLLTEKAKQIFDLGVRRFGLFLDDIPGKLQHADDRVRFSSLAEAHVDVCNAFAMPFPGGIAMSAWRFARPSISERAMSLTLSSWDAASIPRSICSLGWRQICSREITVDEAVRFQRFTGRPPLYWDNYPVNDAAG